MPDLHPVLKVELVDDSGFVRSFQRFDEPGVMERLLAHGDVFTPATKHELQTQIHRLSEELGL